jgi:hypothetical protein
VKRRTDTLEIEWEGDKPDPLDLRDALLRLRPSWGSKVVHVEIVENGKGQCA